MELKIIGWHTAQTDLTEYFRNWLSENKFKIMNKHRIEQDNGEYIYTLVFIADSTFNLELSDIFTRYEMGLMDTIPIINYN